MQSQLLQVQPCKGCTPWGWGSWPIWRVLYLDGWNSIPHSRLHLPGVWRSSCNCCSVSVGFLVLQYMYLVVSSAKKLIFDNIPSEMSLMKMRNRMVQRTDPVGAKMSRTHFGGHYFQHNPLGMISPWVWSPLSTSESCLPCHAQLVKEAVVGHFVKLDYALLKLCPVPIYGRHGHPFPSV